MALLLPAELLLSGAPGLPGPGGVVVSGPAPSDRILALGPLAELRGRFPGIAERRVLRAIAPRLVNAHTHLDLSDYPLLAGSFPDFLAGMFRVARAQPGLRGVAAALRAVNAMAAAGVGAVGDIVGRLPVMEALLRDAPVEGVAYWEVIERHGAKPVQNASEPVQNASRASQIDAELMQIVSRFRRLRGSRGLQPGLSPHSPFSVSRPLLQSIARVARAESVPLQIHVGESAAEMAFFRTGGGPLLDAWAAAGLSRAPSAAALGIRTDISMTPVKYLTEIGFLEARPTLVHMVHATDEDLDIVAQHGCAVVTCPRSNAALGAPPFAWKRFADRGIPVALGTDSIATAGSLDLASEIGFCFKYLGDRIDLKTILLWIVEGGRRALGLPPALLRPGDPLSSLTFIRQGQTP